MVPSRRELQDGGVLVLREHWLSDNAATCLFDLLLDDVGWKQETIRIAGKEYLQPRLSAWYGDRGAAYKYSGLSLEPLAWTPALAKLRGEVEAEVGSRFNSALLNLYRNGQDSMGLHADNERELGANPVIASVSLGAARRFILKYATKDVGKGAAVDPVEILLEHGSLLLMEGTTKHHWKHYVPKERGVLRPRINLTFRWVAVGSFAV